MYLCTRTLRVGIIPLSHCCLSGSGPRLPFPQWERQNGLAVGPLSVLTCSFSVLFSSYVNVQEIKVVIELIKLLKDKRRDVTFRNIGIITHYKAQKTMIQKELDKEFEGKG